MSFQVRYLQEVREDIQDAWLWYEEQKEGLGDEFVDHVETAIQKISLNPFRFPIASENRRKAVLPRFPFTIFFEVVEPDIIIIAVFHFSRNPSSWKNRNSHEEE